MVRILDNAGHFLEETTRHGYVRRLLKDNKAKVVLKEPFTIQLTENITMNKKMNVIDIIVLNIELLYGQLTDTEKILIIPQIVDLIKHAQNNSFDDFITMSDVANYLIGKQDKTSQAIGSTLKQYKYILDKIAFDISEPEEDEEDEKLPISAYLKPSNDTLWNCFPLGVVVNNRNDLQSIGWFLNNENNSDSNVYATIPSTVFVISGGTGSGKSIVERSIIRHVNSFKDHFNLIGIDCRRLEFQEKDFDGIANDPIVAKSAAEVTRQVMMSRFKIMEQCKINNICKAANLDYQVNYYQVGNDSYQFDEIVCVYINKDTKMILSIEDLYDRLAAGTYKSVTFKDRVITSNDIKKTTGSFKFKALVLMVNYLEDITSADLAYSNPFMECIGSIARLGRAAGVYLVLGCSRANEDIFTSDLLNNVQMTLAIGAFDSKTSNLLLDQDLSEKTNPTIKGRGFIRCGNEITETQIYAGLINWF